MSESEWVKVADVNELTVRRKKKVSVGDEEIALFLNGEDVYALHDVCIHKQRSLSQGTVLNGRVICPGHQWAYNLETGWEAEREECQPTYPVKVENGEVHVLPKRQVLVDEAALD